ncbi:MAG: AMP-binding protein [Candidatus Limnocylindrales bacterium]
MESLVELLERAAARYGDRTALGIRRDDGTGQSWSYRELERRSRIVAWRLTALGLVPGDRLLTWSPSEPELPAVYLGAMRAGIVLVPLDLRMAPDAIERIVEKAEARHLAIGTGRESPDPRDARLDGLPTTTVEALAAESDGSFPADWEERVAALPRPDRSTLFELVFTSGTTGAPKGVMLTHGNVLASIEAIHRVIPPLEHRIVSLLPLSHLLEQAVGLLYAIDVGADILYVRSRNPRVIFESIRDHRTTSMILVPQVLDLFWSSIEREVERSGRSRAFGRLRRVARRLPYPARRWLFRRVHAEFGGGLRLLVSTAAFLPPALQQAWEDLGVVIIQGYGSTECGFAACTSREDHGLGTVGRSVAPVEVRLADDGEILVHGPNVFGGYWRDPASTAAAFTTDGWYRTGDIGRLDPEGRLILMGRTKDIIVLPNGLNVYPEDIENALRVAGNRDSVVVETLPGRIEAVVLAPGSHAIPQGGTPAEVSGTPAESSAAIGGAEVRAEIDEAIRSANRALAIHQRIVSWRLWPEADFPRTHTLKVKRDQVRRWAAVEEPLPVREGS